MWATLTGVTSGIDFVCGQSFSVAIAVVWEATGDPTRDRTHELVTVDGCSADIRFNGVVQPAVAEASTSVGRVNVTPIATDRHHDAVIREIERANDRVLIADRVGPDGARLPHGVRVRRRT
jgi:hypothetical protein